MTTSFQPSQAVVSWDVSVCLFCLFFLAFNQLVLFSFILLRFAPASELREKKASFGEKKGYSSLDQAAAFINLWSCPGSWGKSARLLVWTATFQTLSQTDIMDDRNLFVMLSSGCVEQYSAISHSGDTGKWTCEMQMEPHVIYLSDGHKALPKDITFSLSGFADTSSFTDGAFKLCIQMSYMCHILFEFWCLALGLTEVTLGIMST